MRQHPVCLQPTISTQIAPPWSRGARAVSAPSLKWRCGAPGRGGRGGAARHLTLVPAGGPPRGPSQTQRSRTPEGEAYRARVKSRHISSVKRDEGDPARQGCPQGHTCK